MPQRFKSVLSGATGTALFAWGVLDVIGRFQTAVGLWGQLNLKFAFLLIIAGPFLVWYAIRRESNENLKKYSAELAQQSSKVLWTPEDPWRPDDKPPGPL